MSDASFSFELLLAGCGAIGSRFAAALAASDVAVTFADNQSVLPENLEIAAFDAADLHRDKATVLAERRRARHCVGRTLVGGLRYTLSSGLIRKLDAVVVCLDNPAAIRDTAEVVWSGAPAALPVLVLTCGGEAGGYQVRFFQPPGLCPVCLFGSAEHAADRRAFAISCDDTSAPRASAAAAAAAALAGAAILERWRAGDRTLLNTRVQRDPDGEREYVIRMPAQPLPRCPVPHRTSDHDLSRVADLGGTVGALSVAALAEAAIDFAGDDAQILLGRRAVPLGGCYCPRCRAVSTAPPLLPAALATWNACSCGAARPLGERNSIGARELLGRDVASLSLRAWGAGHGDEFVAAGRKGDIRLRCAFDWRNLDEP